MTSKTGPIALIKAPPFPATSRYYGLGTATITPEGGGRTVAYLRRRFVPPPERFQTLQVYTVAPGDRLDNVAADQLGDPEQAWRLCDANNAMGPDELTSVVGRRIKVGMPEGVPGIPGA